MPDHVRIDCKLKSGTFTSPGQYLAYARGRKRRATLAHKQIIGLRIVPLQSPQSAYLRAIQGVRAVLSTFGPFDMDSTFAQVYLAPLKGD